MLSGENRFSRFSKGSPRIAYLYERTDNSTFRYRVHNMIEVIGACWPEASASYFTLEDDQSLLDKVADSADYVVICRARYSNQISRFITRVRKRPGVPLIFDVDDLVFDTSYVHLLMSSLNRPMSQEIEWDHWFAYTGRIGETLKQCDYAITTNEFLGEKIKAYSALSYSVIPNFMNEWQISHSKKIWEKKRSTKFKRNQYIHIGYFSGSPTHAKDFAVAESALVKILEKNSQVRMRMVGYLDLPKSFLPYKNMIEREKFRDYVNLQTLIGSTEINIAPLQDNEFTNCKSELKYFEASAVGAATIASPTFTFRNSISDGINGYISAEHEWEEKIQNLVDDIQIGSEKSCSVLENAYAHCIDKYTWSSQIGSLKSVFC